jgi:ribosomal protein S18 acetylase RimI-like enzyme
VTAPVREGSSAVAAPGAGVEVMTWRPVETVDVDGWGLGFSGGFTRRANSVVPRRAPADLAGTLHTVEAAYAARGLPSVFRIDGSAQPTDLDAVLDARGYALVAGTRVMARTLEATRPHDAVPDGTSVAVAEHPDDAWLGGWLDVKAAGRGIDTALARGVVTGSPALYLTARDEAGVAGVVRAALVDGWVGLSCLMVAPRTRRRGLARSLSAAALAHAAVRGARRAFLQVEASNGPAVALYESLGFAVVDEYHYRERRAP